MRKYVSIDIGGTAIKYGIIDEDGRILERQKMSTEAQLGGTGILKKVKGIVENYCNQDIISGICISTAGMVDTDKGEIFYAGPTIPAYAGTTFKNTLEEKFHIPCEVENDVNCAGLAESVAGAAKGSSSALMLTVGTGIGGCIILGGKVFHGFSNSACEVGYMNLEGGEFQKMGAASILAEKVSKRKGDSRQEWDGCRIFEEAKKGDAICTQAIDEMADVLGRGIANICYVLNPETVVLGGGIMEQEAFLKGRIQKALDKYLIDSINKNTSLRFAKHRNDAGMLGAYYHFCSKQSQSYGLA